MQYVKKICSGGCAKVHNIIYLYFAGVKTGPQKRNVFLDIYEIGLNATNMYFEYTV